MLQVMVMPRQIRSHFVLVQQWPELAYQTLGRSMLSYRPHRKMSGHKQIVDILILIDVLQFGVQVLEIVLTGQLGIL